jgi:signal transduction histidine kinase
MKESHRDRLGKQQNDNQWRLDLARRLHDGAQQQLVDIIINLRRADQMWTERPEESRQLVELAAAEAQRALEGLRELASEVYPIILASRGVGPALHSLALQLPFPLEVDVPANVVPPELDETVYFLCYHALIDVPSHEEVASSRLAIVSTGSGLAIDASFEGNGEGSGPMRASLDSLSERVAAKGGRVELTAQSDRNLDLVLHIPPAD